ncbi:hypothetical protein [Acanthopleuribacter pedis]|uniref:Uncharacterized protein n=1 Tax=Acanthopleuribacter pedis TaxID=442870 RepID=A0A8J7Q6T8_9BACT|nr:hypothetical protein [Acanthopleuribacter pedis]MBO1319740.1 hypothetical protein [Acanthopleuribacter pedis]
MAERLTQNPKIEHHLVLVQLLRKTLHGQSKRHRFLFTKSALQFGNVFLGKRKIGRGVQGDIGNTALKFKVEGTTFLDPTKFAPAVTIKRLVANPVEMKAPALATPKPSHSRLIGLRGFPFA